MTINFNRLYRLQIRYKDGPSILDTEQLRVTFQIFKGLSSNPNQTKINVYNLNQETQKRLNSSQVMIVSLAAGYPGNTDIICLGTKRTIDPPVIESVDSKIQITVGDGDLGIRYGTISQSFAPETAVSIVVKALAGTIRDTSIGTLNGLENKKIGFRGESLSGDSKVLLDRFGRQYDFSWSIQDGIFETVGIDPDKPDSVIGNIQTTAFKISKEVGMVGIPVLQDNKRIKVRALLNPRLKPGRAIAIESENTNGFFKVLNMKMIGDTRGKDWYMDLDCISLGGA